MVEGLHGEGTIGDDMMRGLKGEKGLHGKEKKW